MTATDFNHLFDRFEREAFRLETLPVYTVAEEQETLAAFLAGTARPLTENPFFSEWHDSIRTVTAKGGEVKRVRILDEPPTDYQRLEIWAGRYNTAAGEILLYLSRSRAVEVGLPLDHDWWLFDSTHLALMEFDPDGRPLGGDLVDDPQLVQQHRAWRELAIRHATPCAQSLPA